MYKLTYSCQFFPKPFLNGIDDESSKSSEKFLYEVSLLVLEIHSEEWE
jgi:hypothetical protein